MRSRVSVDAMATRILITVVIRCRMNERVICDISAAWATSSRLMLANANLKTPRDIARLAKRSVRVVVLAAFLSWVNELM